MLARLVESLWALAKAIDILVCTLWLAPLYVLNLSDKPTGRQLISSYVGRAAFNNKKWGLVAAKVIDYIAKLFGDDIDHCYRAYIKYKGLDE